MFRVFCNNIYESFINACLWIEIQARLKYITQQHILGFATNFYNYILVKKDKCK
jgi:hypothetical protein